MSHFGREFNQIEDGLSCPLKMFLVWHVMHKFQRLNLKSLIVIKYCTLSLEKTIDR